MDDPLNAHSHCVCIYTYMLSNYARIYISQVQSSFDPTVQLTPPPIDTPTITFTSSPGNLSGNAVFVPDSSYQLTDTVENDVYTFTVTVTNVAGSSSEVSAVVEGKISFFCSVITYVSTLF